MSINITSNKNIVGIHCNSIEHKISQYADDANLVLSNIISIMFALDEIQLFSNVSGLRLNMCKTEGILLGPLKDLKFKNIYGITIVDSPIRCLGLYVGLDMKICEALNWERKVDNFEHTLLSWQKWYLTLFGKVTILNVLAIPKLIYLFTLLHVPEWVIERLEKAITNFLWNKRNRINRNCLYAKVEQGGLGLIDIKSKISSLKATWITKWFTSENEAWTDIACMFLNKIELTIEIIMKFNTNSLDTIPVVKKLPLFYQDVIEAFLKCKTNKSIERMNSFDFFTNSIWGNHIIMTGNKCIIFKNWVKANIIYIKDIFDENGNFLNEQYITNILPNCSNWISEFYILKTIIMKYVQKYKFDTKICKYINIKSSNFDRLLFDNKYVILSNTTSSLFYKILINLKITLG